MPTITKKANELLQKDENGNIVKLQLAPLAENIAVTSKNAANLDDYIKFVDSKFEAG